MRRMDSTWQLRWVAVFEKARASTSVAAASFSSASIFPRVHQMLTPMLPAPTAKSTRRKRRVCVRPDIAAGVAQATRACHA